MSYSTGKKALPILIIAYCLGFQLVFAQKLVHEASIQWEAPRSFGNQHRSFKAAYFGDAVYNFQEDLIPRYCKQLPLKGKPSEIKATLLNTNYTPLNAAERKLVKMPSGKPGASLSADLSYARGKASASLCLKAIRKNPNSGQLEKLLSFKVEITPVYEAKKVAAPPAFADSSVLTSGTWHKISVTEDGIHRITPAFLSDLGFNISGLAVSAIRLFGNGGGMLPESNATFRHNDPQENAIHVEDVNNDGIFNGSDYILFYAQGPHRWRYNQNSSRYEHIYNIYSEASYYFITTDYAIGTPKRINLQSANTQTPTHNVSTYDDYAFREDDEVNLVGTGRQWFGDYFDFNLSYNYNFSFPDIDVSTPVFLRVRGVARSSTSSTSFSTLHQNSVILINPFSAVSAHSGANYVDATTSSTTFTANSINIPLTVRYDNAADPAGIAWLDYIELNVRRNLTMSSSQLIFRDIQSVGNGNVTEFTLANAGNSEQLWDVTNPVNVFEVPTSLSGSDRTFRVNSDSLREFVAFRGTNFPLPADAGSVTNSNLHGTQQADLVIVTHPSFETEAERLAEHHRNHDNMTVLVATTEQIYNEFSSGAQDITAIKDLLRMLVAKAGSLEEVPENLLLFGDASYDYKDRISNNNNYVPIYESQSSFSLESSYSTDDYFGFLDDHEGNNINADRIDVGIGRFPVGTLSEAEAAVDKVIRYATAPETFGDWRNSLLFVADDVDEAWERSLINDADRIAEDTRALYKNFNINKIYMDAYQQTSTAGSQRYPEARNDLFRGVEKGNLITTYVGHGGEVGWAHERILQLSDINSWTNRNSTPVFMTVTCEFTRVDDPTRVSAGEQVFLNPQGAGVGLYSTTRSVLANTTQTIGGPFFDIVFTKDNGEFLTMGEVMRRTKNQSLDAEKRKFSLFGDPALKMAIPEHTIATTRINGMAISTTNDTMKALNLMTISGEIQDNNGQKMTGFNGVIYPTIYDKSTELSTLTNDGAGAPFDFDLQKNIIYRGKVAVVNGDFEFRFIVPKDISYAFGNGRISYYATDTTDDASGYYENVIIGGFNNDAPEDDLGPEVRLFMNDENFVSGGLTNEDPQLLALITDSSGVNTVGNGIGHDLLAILDQNTQEPYILNDYYEANLNSYQSGTIRYPFFDLGTGRHTLSLTVWDVYNNASDASLEFVVAESAKLAIEHVLNYPNPFTTYTEFHFEHNKPDDALRVQVQIFTVSGKLIKTIHTQLAPTGGNRVNSITWNGLDDYGDKIGRGVYVYRLKVRASDNSSAEEYEKLVILR